MEKYESDSIQNLKHYMFLYNIKQKDLIGIIGDAPLVSKVLNRKRKLNLKMIRNLHFILNIPLEYIIKEY